MLRGALRNPNRVLASSRASRLPYAVARTPTPKSVCASPRHTRSTPARAASTAATSTSACNARSRAASTDERTPRKSASGQ